ncbi:hypothetical protein Tco_1373490, partial [Tanacetum coccineum]
MERTLRQLAEKEQKMLEDGTYHLLGRDPITQDLAPCDLLWPYGPDEFRVAIGKVYPTRDATLHGSSMSEGYIKVQVDTVEDAYKAIPVPKTTEKVSLLEHTILEFIEWPRKKIKLESHGTLHPQSGYPPTSWPQMVEQSVSSHPVTSEPVKPKKTQEERVKERLDKLINKPKPFQDSVKRFTKCKKKTISIVAPHEMYFKDWEEWIEYEAILDVHINAKVDISFIHWWA